VTVIESIINTVQTSFMGFEVRLRDLRALCCTVLHESHCATRVVGDAILRTSVEPLNYMFLCIHNAFLFIYLF
jgi:hypothetical protein